MAENVNCTTWKENPELFKIKLRSAIEQITSDTSENMNAIPVQEQGSLFEKYKNILKNEIHKTVYNFIDNMWNQMEITQKILFLRELEAKYPKDFLAWRPTAGEIPILSLKGSYLKETKERLLYKIQKLKEEHEELKKIHAVKLNALKESFEKMNKGEEHLFGLWDEYEKIVKNR